MRAPQALAELSGILLNDGAHNPSLAGDCQIGPPGNDWRRAERNREAGRGGLMLAGGTVLSIGGKTGTGDNRFQEFGSYGSLISSHV